MEIDLAGTKAGISEVLIPDQVLLDVFSSPSWQLAKPLPTVKRLLRG